MKEYFEQIINIAITIKDFISNNCLLTIVNGVIINIISFFVLQLQYNKRKERKEKEDILFKNVDRHFIPSNLGIINDRIFTTQHELSRLGKKLKSLDYLDKKMSCNIICEKMKVCCNESERLSKLNTVGNLNIINEEVCCILYELLCCELSRKAKGKTFYSLLNNIDVELKFFNKINKKIKISDNDFEDLFYSKLSFLKRVLVKLKCLFKRDKYDNFIFPRDSACGIINSNFKHLFYKQTWRGYNDFELLSKLNERYKRAIKLGKKSKGTGDVISYCNKTIDGIVHLNKSILNGELL